ncbi:putative Permease of the drug/metabolite transporter (DMT) superfamily [Sphingomonas sp. MM-1]|uniref:EamA family transporter RarD n=1 Tax=Sphingomonas sp. MM-1 TaxID=745310 RepID=UPI0002C0C6C0|nr:EamA family transporter RarD [Sphingomonas sp. MM-1]AGH48528.1 putative Permease of the drug/metabolite transporter (DMT) superfamily [Sphingomonas sp. MM-1]
MSRQSPSASQDEARSGVFLALSAYLIWGLLPLYLKQIMHVPPVQIVAHRTVWSFVLVAVIVLAFGRLKGIRAALRTRGTFGLLMVSATLIALNWLFYTWAILHEHVLEASLGYFINPLVNVALGMIFLKERLRPVQWLAVGLAGAGVIVMAVAQGGAVWISLALALTFGLYGLVRKVVAIDALGGLAVETTLLAPVALGWLMWCAHTGEGVFGVDRDTDLLLIAGGLLTTTPLLLFAAAARRMRYTAMGLIQYLTPTLVFFQGILLFGEPLTTVHIITFGLIWAGLAVYVADMLRAHRAMPVTLPE